MEAAPVQDLSFLQCYICFQNVKKPKMCPSCSKLACLNCLRTWIQESKSQCPHCRKPLMLSSFADCQRFVNDIKHIINNIQSNQKLKEKCAEHRIQMQYYCEDCKEPICSDCGMFGSKHRGHNITHLSKIYQENKNKILNQLARFDTKIELFRKNGHFIKMEMQKLMIQIGNKKTFIEEYFVGLIERLDQEYKQKREKVQAKYDKNVQEIEFLQTFRDNICQELQGICEKELITRSQEFINCIKSLCDEKEQIQQEEYSFDTIHELVPKYKKFTYILKNYSEQVESIIYSDPYEINGIEWRLKIYPKGNGVAKNTHISVFLQMSKGYQNDNKYEYKIELVNRMLPKETVTRQYSSKFDLGECWGYNQFISLVQLQHGFLCEDDALHFNVNVRNPSYRSLVKDQQHYIKSLQNKLNSNESIPTSASFRKEKMNELAQEAISKKIQMKNFLNEDSISSISNKNDGRMDLEDRFPEMLVKDEEQIQLNYGFNIDDQVGSHGDK